MGELVNNLMPKITAAPQMQQLQLPKLKKIGQNKPELPKLKLPKLKKIELPKLKKVEA